METKAVTFWNGIVSPVYDAAESIMIVFSNGKREIFDVGRMSIYEKAEFLEEKDVQVLICGAISTMAQAALTNKGIDVFSWVRGPVKEVLQAHSLNTLEEEPFLMPGCRAEFRCRRKLRGERRNRFNAWKLRKIISKKNII